MTVKLPQSRLKSILNGWKRKRNLYLSQEHKDLEEAAKSFLRESRLKHIKRIMGPYWCGKDDYVQTCMKAYNLSVLRSKKVIKRRNDYSKNEVLDLCNLFKSSI